MKKLLMIFSALFIILVVHVEMDTQEQIRLLELEERFPAVTTEVPQDSCLIAPSLCREGGDRD